MVEKFDIWGWLQLDQSKRDVLSDHVTTETNWPRDLRRATVRMNVALESGSVADLRHTALQVLGETQSADRRLCVISH